MKRFLEQEYISGVRKIFPDQEKDFWSSQLTLYAKNCIACKELKTFHAAKI